MRVLDYEEHCEERRVIFGGSSPVAGDWKGHTMSNNSQAQPGPDGRHERRRGLPLPGGRIACLAAGVTAGVALARVMGQKRHRAMPHLSAFQKGLAASHGEVMASVLATRIQHCYDEYLATRPRFEHPALRWHLEYQILPGLALYQILRDNAVRKGLPPSTALKEAGALLERMEMLARVLPLTRYQPFTFAIFRRVVRLSLAPLFPAKGWDIQMVEDSPRRLAFNISRCFYLDVLRAYGAPELTEYFCHLDDLAYAALPPSIKWERTTTLAQGGSVCDFCWRADGKAPSHSAEKEALDSLVLSGPAR